MSHQSGISPSRELLDFFSSVKNSDVRLAQVKISQEQFILASVKNVESSWAEDYKSFIPPVLENSQPCYIFFRLDTKRSYGYYFLFITWIPDEASITDKMLYASSKFRVRDDFDISFIKDDLSASSKHELLYDVCFDDDKLSYENKARAKLEHKLKDLDEIEMPVVSPMSRKSRSIPFHIDSSVLHALEQLKSGTYNYVALLMDVNAESIILADKKNIRDASEIQIPEDHPKFHIWNCTKRNLSGYVFVFSMPGCQCPVMERMLYSSSLSTVVNAINAAGIHFIKRIEVGDCAELLQKLEEREEVSSPTVKLLFDKPQKPVRTPRSAMRKK